MASPEWCGERWRATGPSLSPLVPLPFPHGARQGTERGVRKHGGTPHAMVARVWYVPNETSGFVDQALRMGLR